MTIEPWTRSNREHLVVTRLTARQARARELLLRGFDVDEIARAMGASRTTVWNHLRLGCWKRIEAERLGHGTYTAIHNRG